MFKKFLVAGLAVAGFAASTAFAQNDATLNVSAKVVGNCQFNTANATMAFGDLDPAIGTDATASASLEFWCTKNATYTITDDGGVNANSGQRRMKSGSNYINYSIDAYTDTGNGAGKTTPITLDLDGTVAGADYEDAAAGNYSDVVTFTINP